MSKSREQILAELDSKIPREVVREREGGGGRTFSYLEGHYVIARMNEIFGQGNWSYFTDEIRCVHSGETGGKQTAHYIAVVKLEVPILGAQFSDVGYGDGSDKYNVGKAHELAAKEAVTDAIKRCAKNLGMSMGLALYDKTQENVDEGESKKAKVGNTKPKASEAAQVLVRDTVAASVSKPAADVPAAPTNSIPAEAPKERAQLNTMISNMSKVIVSKKTKTVGDLRTEMKSRYGSDQKEQLTDEQATAFYSYLREIL